MTLRDASCKLLRIGMFTGINWLLYCRIGPLKLNKELVLWRFMWYIRSHNYNKAKQDGGAKETKCVSSDDHTHANINHTVTF